MNEIFDQDGLALFLRFLFNVLVVSIVTRLFYYSRNKGKRELLFTYISISALVFIICLVLSRIPVEFGFALGLFAIFSIIRFRSIQLSPRELTYLFVSIGLGVYNALANTEEYALRVLIGNLVMISLIGIAEWALFRTSRMVKFINYDKPELLSDDHREALKRDIEERFGISHIENIQAGDVDAVKGRVKLRITFIDKDNTHFSE